MKFKGEPAKVVPAACAHKTTEFGPRVPMRHGSAPTVVCKACKAWRTVLHSFGPWRHDQTVEQAAREPDDVC